MLKPNHDKADLLMTVARRHGQHPVNRRHQPPLRVFKQLIKGGYLKVTRPQGYKPRTTWVVFTPKGREEAIKLAPHYGMNAANLAADEPELKAAA
ncbi:hypothetical protein [Erythrobacter aureus]|uniref:Uncharacterized protein n=1 Tax=Erythrobacter aureus TaxID=2182384 RepID=A0A345YIT6_9SPHN|nr:hypothetical protein [Erythrobacter aureus]AXK43838.1 hypothetical protein DVR09_15395 [Erythrobacter aureus]